MHARRRSQPIDVYTYHTVCYEIKLFLRRVEAHKIMESVPGVLVISICHTVTFDNLYASAICFLLYSRHV